MRGSEAGALGESVLRIPINACASAFADCPCAQPEGRNFFEGACVPSLNAADRSVFFDLCLSARDNERLCMGRELHDVTGQLLVALRLDLAHLHRLLGVGPGENLFQTIEDTVEIIAHEISSFSYLHYPAELGKNGLATALAILVRGFSKRTGLHIEFEQKGNCSNLNGATAAALLRIAQEGLTNVHRHAHATSARLSLVEKHGALELTIRDNGCGMPPANTLSLAKGVGLRGMRHRIESLDGNFVMRRLKRGTKLVARLPAARLAIAHAA